MGGIIPKLLLSFTVLANYNYPMVESQPVNRPRLPDVLTSKEHPDERILEEIIPVLRQIKTLKNVLNAKTIPALYAVYAPYHKDTRINWQKTKKLESMEQKLRSCKTSLELLQNIRHFLKKYSFHLTQLLDYNLQSNHVDFTEQMAERANIFSKLEQILNLGRVEIREVIRVRFPEEKGGGAIEFSEFKKCLVKIPSSGDIGAMEMLDTSFLDHLRRYLDVVIYLLQYKISVNNVLSDLE